MWEKERERERKSKLIVSELRKPCKGQTELSELYNFGVIRRNQIEKRSKGSQQQQQVCTKRNEMNGMESSKFWKKELSRRRFSVIKSTNDLFDLFCNGQPRPLFRLFSVFSNKQCEKMSYPSSIRRRDSNPQPLKHESSPITTRPEHPPFIWLVRLLMSTGQRSWHKWHSCRFRN